MIFKFTDFGTTQELADKTAASELLGTDFHPVMEAVALDMMRVEEIIFSSQGRRAGGSWAHLADDTVKRKNGDTRILLTSGNPYAKSTGASMLFKSLTRPGAQDQILEITRTRIEFGTEREYAQRQFKGGKGIPARPFIDFTPADRHRWDGWFARHVMKPFMTGEPYLERFR